MTPEQLHILQHSLGLDEYGRGTKYRNRFVCDPNTEMEELVAMGLMRCRGLLSFADGMHCYYVTPAGEAAIAAESPKPPKVSRGRQRYLRWLEVADCYPDMNFGDWLKLPKETP